MQQGAGPFRRFMREEALGAAGTCDVALLVIDVSHRKQRDMASLQASEAAPMLESLANFAGPVILGLNKVDCIAEKSELLPLLTSFDQDGRFDALIPFSAKTGSGTEGLLQQVASKLPKGPELFPEEMFTDRAERFLAAELIREQLSSAW
jgi:GTP-binding protein Era